MRIPVVAIGGVTELADVLDFLAVGAVAVQVGTAIFADPTLPVRLVDELAADVRGARADVLPRPHRHGAPAEGGAAVGQGRRVPALSASTARAGWRQMTAASIRRIDPAAFGADPA